MVGTVRNRSEIDRNRFVSACGHQPGHFRFGFVRFGGRFGSNLDEIARNRFVPVCGHRPGRLGLASSGLGAHVGPKSTTSGRNLSSFRGPFRSAEITGQCAVADCSASRRPEVGSSAARGDRGGAPVVATVLGTARGQKTCVCIGLETATTSGTVFGSGFEVGTTSTRGHFDAAGQMPQRCRDCCPTRCP